MLYESYDVCGPGLVKVEEIFCLQPTLIQSPKPHGSTTSQDATLTAPKHCSTSNS